MARSLLQNCRFYADGYDLSGNTRSFGPLDVSFETSDISGLTWAAKGSLLGKPAMTIGTLNGIFDTATGEDLHTFAQTIASRNVLALIGGVSAPALGCPAFAGKFNQTGYPVEFGDVMITASIPFGAQPITGLTNYQNPWGVCLHPSGSETGANSSAGVDNAAATTAGGYMAYQILSITGTGSATITVQDSADNNTWLALSGATTGAVANTSAPTSGIVQLATTATVRRYLRWQLSLTGATACTFVLAFIRG